MAEPFVSTPVIREKAVSPLEGHAAAHRSTGAPGVTLSERFGLAICDVAAWPGKFAAVGKALDGTGEIIPHAPGRFTVIADDPDLPVKLGKTLGDAATVVDLAHGRTLIRVSGAKSEWVLAKLFAIDFSPGAFPVGHGLATKHHEIFAQIRRADAQTFDVLVYRSFARSFWHTLTVAGEEVGVAVV